MQKNIFLQIFCIDHAKFIIRYTKLISKRNLRWYFEPPPKPPTLCTVLTPTVWSSDSIYKRIWTSTVVVHLPKKLFSELLLCHPVFTLTPLGMIYYICHLLPTTPHKTQNFRRNFPKVIIRLTNYCLLSQLITAS